MTPLEPTLLTPQLSTCVGYTRGSTLEQQNTLVAQATDIRNYAAYRKLGLAETFVDSGESAVSVPFLERPKVAEMLAFMQQHGITAIIITKLDRGFRDAVDLLTTVDILQARGISIHLLDIGLDPTSPLGKAICTIMAAIAAFECERRSERQHVAFAAMKQQGQRCGNIPYGWRAIPSRRVSKTGRQAEDLEPVPEEQAIIRRLTIGDLATLSGNEAARRLIAENIPTKKGAPWKGATIHGIRKRA